MSTITPQELYAWCKVPYEQLENHPQLKIPFRLCRDSDEMGALMARELVDEIQSHNRRQEVTRAIIPCGPACWYKPFTDLVNREKVSLKKPGRLPHGRMPGLAGPGTAARPSL